MCLVGMLDGESWGRMSYQKQTIMTYTLGQSRSSFRDVVYLCEDGITHCAIKYAVQEQMGQQISASLDHAAVQSDCGAKGRARG